MLAPAAAVLALLCPQIASGQQAGTVVGRITDARSGQPISSVQVFISEREIGSLTQQNGRYLLVNVPAGTYEIQAARIGYRTESQSVTVTPGGTSIVDFSMSEDALQLEAVIVTGTPGGTQQRAVGNVVGRVDAADIASVAEINTFQDMLSGREPGVEFTRASGNVGTGSAVRVRGYTSLGVGNQPLIYVDGIRVDNRFGVGPNLRDGAQVSKLDDINPDDIESIEIIKGPAAATLYGTEASNGVIQIITKRGSVGSPQFDLTVRGGVNWLMNPSEKVGEAYGTDPVSGEIVSFNIWEVEKAAGRQFFDNGPMQQYNLGMRGGTDAVRYYIAADYEDSEGIVDYNWDKRLNLRANATVVPVEQLSIDISTGYLDGKTSFMQQKTSWGVWEQAQWSTPLGIDTKLRGFLRARPEAIAEIEATRDNSRYLASSTVSFTPLDWFTHRLVLGLDVANEENRVLFPRDPEGANHDFGGLSLGSVEIDRPSTTYITLDYATTVSYGLGEDIGFKTSVGVQYYSKRLETVSTSGRIFPAPPVTSLAGAAQTTSTEQLVENKTLGTFIQQEFSYQNRIFLTAAVRGDDNSAFGANFDAAVYPKLSATWVVSEESFFPEDFFVNSFRLRSAWGKAGQQPDVFAAVRLYNPQVGPGGVSALTPAEVGNPDIGPEVSTEFEVGFDAALLNDRISTEVTYYTQTVTDALISLPVAPSSGFFGFQQQNVGEVKNWGWEVNVLSRVIDGDNVALDLGGSLAYSMNEITDLGGRPPTETFREGFPFPATMDPVVVSAEIDPTTNRVTNIMCDGGTGKQGLELGGSPIPCGPGTANTDPDRYIGPGFSPWTMNYNATVTLYRDLRIFANVDHRVGRRQYITDVSCRHACFQTSLAANLRDDPIFLSYAETSLDGGMLSNFDASFLKLREIGATWNIPSRYVERTGADRASITLAGRNLWTIWRAEPTIFGAPVPDPEIQRANDIDTGSNSNVPPASSFSATLRVSF